MPQPETIQLPLFRLNSSQAEYVGSLDQFLVAPDGIIAIDFETRDYSLKADNTGNIHGAADKRSFVCGVSLATAQKAAYISFRHVDSNNRPYEDFVNFLNQLKSFRIIVANYSYDLPWIFSKFVPMDKLLANHNTFYDVLLAEALLDEWRLSYSLDSIAKDYGLPGKNSTEMDDYAKMIGINNPKERMDHIPARYVAPYAIHDARITLEIHRIQQEKLAKERLLDVCNLEMGLAPYLANNYLRGVRVDIDKAIYLADEFNTEKNALMRGINFNQADIWSAEACARHLQKFNIEVPKTASGKFSVDKNFLANLKHPEADKLRRIREFDRCIEKYILADIVMGGSANGRVYPKIVQTSSTDDFGDKMGVKGGRCSCVGINIQQIPVRSRNIPAWKIRTLYLPEEGAQWAKHDYDSQEPRMQAYAAHACRLPSVMKAIEYFDAGKKLYKLIEDLIPGVTYDDAKMVFLAKSYKMQPKTFSDMMGIDIMRAEEILLAVDDKLPYMTQLSDMAEAAVKKDGFLRTIRGRKCRFPMATNGSETIKLEDLAVVPAGHRRMDVYKAFNRYVQGSCGDQTKLAMLDAFRAGLFVMFPVHDEIDQTFYDVEEVHAMKKIMSSVINLGPIEAKVDTSIGPNWGDAKTKVK